MPSLARIVDQLGMVKAQIANLEATEQLLRDALAASGIEKLSGKLFLATVSTHPYSVTDWQSIAYRLKASRRLIKANSVESQRTVVKLTAK